MRADRRAGRIGSGRRRRRSPLRVATGGAGGRRRARAASDWGRSRLPGWARNGRAAAEISHHAMTTGYTLRMAAMISRVSCRETNTGQGPHACSWLWAARGDLPPPHPPHREAAPAHRSTTLHCRTQAPAATARSSKLQGTRLAGRRCPDRRPLYPYKYFLASSISWQESASPPEPATAGIC